MTASTEERWEALANLFGAYLNQELSSEHGGPWEAVKAYRDDEPPEVVVRTALQARDLCSAIDDEQELQRIMIDIGIEYLPWNDGWNTHQFLDHLATALTS